MKTNNREFIRLKYIALIILFLFIIIYLVGFSRDIMFVLGIILMGSLYISFQNVVKELYCEMREVIAYAANDQQTIIKDGDLGLLYNEMMRLKKRTVAYEKVIQQEKDKLHQMIEDICHQLKTPLTSISIYNDLLLDGKIQDNYFEEINQQIEKMKYLINSLLTLAKLQSSQIEFEFEYQSIQEVIQLSMQSLQPLIKKTRIQIHIEELETCFYYDESWLQEALSNILKNSLEQTCSRIDITFLEHQQYLKMFIYNDGEAIQEKDLPHIFERFYHTKKQQGVGIGLALSKEIIEKHHGSIQAYNDRNGVVFEILFPRYQMNNKFKVS